MFLTGSGTTSVHEERLQTSEVGPEGKTSQFEIVFQALARFSTQFRVKKSFKLSLAKIW